MQSLNVTIQMNVLSNKLLFSLLLNFNSQLQEEG